MGKQVLLWQIVHHCIQHFTVDSILEGGGWEQGKKSTENENIWTSLKSHPLQGHKMLTDPRPNPLQRGASLVLSRNSVEISSLPYNRVKVPLTQQLCRSNSCTESGRNWDHLLPHMKMQGAQTLKRKDSSHEAAIFCRR